MKDALVLLFLLNVRTATVCSQPYQADSYGSCLDPSTEYLLDDSALCCKKCQPGQRRKQSCSETTATECEECPSGQFNEQWNYSPNCQSCNKCKPAKGLRYAQNCSSTTRSRCACLPGMYCLMGLHGPFCDACRKYSLCRVGSGVSVPGTAASDVKCQRCPEGAFSDTESSTDRCRPHTICHRSAVRQGTATSDTVCESEVYNPPPRTSTREPQTETWLTTTGTILSTASDSEPPLGWTDSIPSVSLFLTETVFNHTTKSPQAGKTSDSMPILAAAIASVIGVILLVIVIILWKTIWRKDAEKVDANGNCDTCDKTNLEYLGKTRLASFTITLPEQQCLLEKVEACSNQSQSSDNTETLTRTDGCSSDESIGPLQSTTALHSAHSALSEPMTLLSNTEPVSPQSSLPTQSSSLPTSPQIISPVTTSPHVNVNITFHIGNGSDRTPSVLPADLMQVDTKLPFGEEEESFSIPQQEAGKQSLMSVQESACYSA